MAILSRLPLAAVESGIPGLDDPQKRVITADVGDVRVVSAYVPNGQSVGSEKYEYKLKWLAALADWLRGELAAHPTCSRCWAITTSRPRTATSTTRGRGRARCSAASPSARRSAALLDLGFADTFRAFEQPAKSYTWWDYRLNAFKRNLGLRIDHILVSPALAAACSGCAIDLAPRRLERPSDHAPVIAQLAV